MRLRMTAAVAALIALVLATIYSPQRDFSQPVAAHPDQPGQEPDAVFVAPPPPEDGPKTPGSIRQAALFVQPVSGSTIASNTRPAAPPLASPEAGSIVRPRGQRRPEAGATVTPRRPLRAEAGSVASVRPRGVTPRPDGPVAATPAPDRPRAATPAPVLLGATPIQLRQAAAPALRPGGPVGPASPVQSSHRRFLVFGPGGLELAAGATDNEISIYDVSSRKFVRTIRNEQGVLLDVVYAPDGALLISASDNQLKLVDPATAKVIRSYAPQATLNSIAITPSGEWLVGGAATGEVVRVSLISGERTQLGQHPPSVSAVAISPDGRFAATGGRDAALRLWPLEDPGQPFVLEGGSMSSNCLAFSSDGRRLANVGSVSRCEVWKLDPLSGPSLERRTAGTSNSTAVFFDREDQFLFVGSRTSPANISRVNLHTGAVTPFPQSLPPATIRDLALSPDGLTLAAVTVDAKVHLLRLDPATLHVVETTTMSPVSP